MLKPNKMNVKLLAFVNKIPEILASEQARSHHLPVFRATGASGERLSAALFRRSATVNSGSGVLSTASRTCRNAAW